MKRAAKPPPFNVSENYLILTFSMALQWGSLFSQPLPASLLLLPLLFFPAIFTPLTIHSALLLRKVGRKEVKSDRKRRDWWLWEREKNVGKVNWILEWRNRMSMRFGHVTLKSRKAWIKCKEHDEKSQTVPVSTRTGSAKSIRVFFSHFFYSENVFSSIFVFASVKL